MGFAKKYFTYPCLGIVAIIVSFLLAYPTGILYDFFFPLFSLGVGDIGLSLASTQEIIGFLINYIFFIAVLFTLFGGRLKYWFIALFCLPYLSLSLLSPLLGIAVVVMYLPVAVAGCFFSIGIKKIFVILLKRNFL